MKRITALMLAVALTLGSVCTAQADGIDIKVKGQWDFAFGWVNNRVFKESVNSSDGKGIRGRNTSSGKHRDNDNFESRQRIRTQINFITSEYLQAVLMFEIGDIDWGRGGSAGRSSGGAIDADGVNVETKLAYLDWMIPQTDVNVRMGIQRVKLPSTRLGQAVLDADVAGIVVSSSVTDWLTLTGFWVRPLDRYRNDSDGSIAGNDNWDDEVDAFGIIAPFTFDGFSISPYFVYGFVGANSGVYNYLYAGGAGDVTVENSSAKAWWLGSNFKLDMFNPLTFSMDFIYGHLQRADVTGFSPSGYSDRLGSSGWYLGATLDYKLDWATPGIFGWYATGDKENSDHDGMLGRMPMLGNDGGNFKATSFGMNGFYAIGNGGNANIVTGTGLGTWGVGIQLADITFIPDLSHTLRVAYYRGTNDSELIEKGGNFLTYKSDGMYLTDDDSVIEVNFDHKYKIYENLEACLELGYLRLKSDEDTWGKYRAGRAGGSYDDSDDAWKAEINFRYSF